MPAQLQYVQYIQMTPLVSSGTLFCDLKNELCPNPDLALAGFEFLNPAKSGFATNQQLTHGDL